MTSLVVSETGPAGAPTLVFLHGGGGSGWMWTPQVTSLSRDYHCLVPDLPEQGGSLEAGPFTIAGAAGQIMELIRTRAHAGRASLIGLSAGAQVSVAVLAQAPELIQSAVISSALLRPLPFASLYRADWLAALFRWSVAPLQNSVWYARLNMRYAGGVPEAYFPQFWADYRRMTADSFAHITAEGMSFRLPAGLARAAAPTLVIVGRREYAAMRQSARDLAAALPNARGVVVDVGRSVAENHNWNLTAPELFTRTVSAWVTEQPLPPELQPL